MGAIFKYNNKYISTQNLQKKLKKMKLSTEQVEIIYEGEANMQELDKMIRDFTSEQIKETLSTNYKYRIYKNTSPPQFMFETNNKTEIPVGVKVLTINGDEFVSYK